MDAERKWKHIVYAKNYSATTRLRSTITERQYQAIYINLICNFQIAFSLYLMMLLYCINRQY